MKIQITFEIDDEDRRAIAMFYGHEGKADYSTAKAFIEGQVAICLDEAVFDCNQATAPTAHTEEVDGNE